MRIVLTLAALAGTWLAAAEPRFTLEQVMNAPFASELTVAPKGGRIAWVFNSRGARNIWLAEAPGYQARRLTTYAGDDGQELSSLTWTPDGLSIVFVRGGEANPLSDPQGSEQALWIVPAAGGAPRRLDDGSAPSVSPQGGVVAYVKKGQVWSAALEGEPKPAQLIKARGECGALRWSPDGTALAFVSTREDYSLAGVYVLGARTVRYLDPSVDRDDYPAWSPDGKRIAFLRTPNSRVLALFGPKREAEPWSIRVAEAATGGSREIWRARPGRGSVFRVVSAANQLLWADGDRIVFPWEADGWTHLYSVPAKGGEAARLTTGEFEVEHVSVSPDGKQIVYSSNEGDPDRRHIWKVPGTQLTRGDSIEWSPLVTGDGGAVVCLRSDARNPGRPYLLEGGKLRDLAPDSLPPDFPAQSLAAPREVTFKAADGMEIRGQLFLPENVRTGERRPAVIFLHGGPRRQMLLGWNYMDYYHNTYAFNQYLAARGYVVLSVNYRSGTGYGLEFREALRYGAVGASEFNDVLGAGQYLKGRPDVDGKRVGLWGGSYGGYLTALGLARASDLFAAGVDLHGVHDWRTETKVFLPSDHMEVREQALRLAFESSPMAHMKGWRSPVLLVHGDDDRNVEFKQTVQLVEALRKQGVEFEQLIFPDEVHSFLRHARWLEAFHAAAEFLDKHLR
ncbi:MAG: S9 family peptidase [Acidobacteriales bacterium]|nr:MAG: S9 family peptidase [Terriglobales bacterium]